MLVKSLIKWRACVALSLITCIGAYILHRQTNQVSAEMQIVTEFKSISIDVINEIDAILQLKQHLPKYAYVALLKKLKISPASATPELLRQMLTQDVVERFAVGCLERGIAKVQDLACTKANESRIIIARPWLCILRDLKIALQLSHIVSPDVRKKIQDSTDNLSISASRIIAEDLLYEYKVTKGRLTNEARSKKIAIKIYNEFLSLKDTA